MTDLFAKLAALQGELPTTSHTYKPLSAAQYEELECQIYRMGPQIDGTPAWEPELMLEWLQQQTPQSRGIAITMMRRAYKPQRVGLPPLPHPIAGRRTAIKQKAKPTTSPPMTTLLSEDGRTVGKRHVVGNLTPVAIDHSGTIRCAITGRTLWIAPGSPTDRATPGAAERLNPIYKSTLHQVVTDLRQHIVAVA